MLLIIIIKKKILKNEYKKLLVYHNNQLEKLYGKSMKNMVINYSIINNNSNKRILDIKKKHFRIIIMNLEDLIVRKNNKLMLRN